MHGQPDASRPRPRSRTTFVWEGLRLLAEERDGRPMVYVYEDQESYVPLARIDGRGEETAVYYCHCQQNGLAERMTDAQGETYWQASFSSWGKTQLEGGPARHDGDEHNLRFQGQYLDRETGLHYNLFRYYDPDVGRFTQHDPIGLVGGLNLYQYVINPLGWVDPLGLSCSFDNKANRWRNKETGRFTRRPTDPSQLVNNGRINKSDIDVWASQGGTPNTWGHDPAKFPGGGFRYNAGSYTVHGHGANPSAAAKFPNSNAAKGPTASMKNTSTGEVFRTDGTWGTFKSDPNGAHIPLDGSFY